jgi:hypothetical protein
MMHNYPDVNTSDLMPRENITFLVQSSRQRSYTLTFQVYFFPSNMLYRYYVFLVTVPKLSCQAGETKELKNRVRVESHGEWGVNISMEADNLHHITVWRKQNCRTATQYEGPM